MIKYLAPAYREVVLAKKPETLLEAKRIAAEFWKGKKYEMNIVTIVLMGLF